MRSGIIASSYMRGEPFVIQAVNLSGFFNFQLLFLGTVKVDWGDGTSSKITSNNIFVQRVFSHTYSSAFTGDIRIIGGDSRVVAFTTRAEIPDTGSIFINASEFRKFKNLQYINYFRSYDNIIGDINEIDMPSLLDIRIKAIGSINENLVNLNYLSIQGGAIQQLPSTLLKLETINFSSSSTYLGSYISDDYTVLSTLNIFGSNTLEEIPIIPSLINLDVRSGNTISSIPNGLINLESIRIEGNNTISTLPSVIESPNITSVYLTGQNTVTSVPEYPDLENLHIRTSSGSVVNTIPEIAPNLHTINIHRFGGNTLFDYPSLNYLEIGQATYQTNITTIEGNYENLNNTFGMVNNAGLVWDLAELKGTPGAITINNATGTGNVTYSGGRVWGAAMLRMTINCELSAGEVDLILNELYSQGVGLTGSNNYINLGGNNAPRTSASDDAVLYLQGLGFTVTTN